MIEQMNKQWSQESREHEKSPQLLLADFNLLTRQRMREVEQTQDEIRYIYEVFNTQGDIGSDECDYLFASLDIIQTAICGLHKLFEDTKYLPQNIAPLYYPLVTELCVAKEHVQKLIQRARAFHSSCQEVSNPVVRLHYTIICDLEALLEVAGNIPCHFQAVCDQVRFLERSSFATVVFGEAVLQTD